MSSTTLRNPYAAILRAIWSIIIDVAQSTANTLGICQLSPITKTSQHENNITPDSGAANPLGLLPYPSKNWGLGVSQRNRPKTAKEQTYWQAVRLLVLKRDNKQCQNCGALENLCVHHLSYEHEGSELDYLDDLTTLCRSCHARVHQGWKPSKSRILTKRIRFNPNGRWQVQYCTWGQYGDLESCIDALFGYPSHVITDIATRRQIEDRCLEIGYISINGWSICYITDEGESTLDTEVD